MATNPLANIINPLAKFGTDHAAANSIVRFNPALADTHTFPIADLANLGTVIANPIDVHPVFPLPSGSGGGGASNPAGYAT